MCAWPRIARTTRYIPLLTTIRKQTVLLWTRVVVLLLLVSKQLQSVHHEDGVFVGKKSNEVGLGGELGGEFDSFVVASRPLYFCEY